MSFSRLIDQVQIHGFAQEIADVAALCVRESGQVFVGLRSEFCANVLEFLGHYEKLNEEYVREKIVSAPCFICGASPLVSDQSGDIGGAAFQVAAATDRIYFQGLRIIAVIVFSRLYRAIGATEFRGGLQQPSADCDANIGVSYRLSSEDNRITSNASAAPPLFRALVGLSAKRANAVSGTELGKVVFDGASSPGLRLASLMDAIEHQIRRATLTRRHQAASTEAGASNTSGRSS